MSSHSTIRLLLVDDSPGFMECSSRFLSGIKGIEIIGQASSGMEAVTKVSELKPDLVLMDLAMPNMSGLEATRLIKSAENPPRVIIVTLYDHPEYRAAALRMKADGYVSKGEFHSKIIEMVYSLATESG